jgi:hypothetical protein
MKDEFIGKARIIFAVAVACALGAYAYFLYPSLRADFSELSLEYLALENEKGAIGALMLDPKAAKERIADMRAQIAGTRKVGRLAAEAAVDDIMGHIARLGIDSGAVEPGEPEELRQEVGSSNRPLLSLPLTISFRSSYDGGMYLIAALEDSGAGSYVIDDFSLAAADGEAGQELMDWIISARLICHGES